MIIPHLPMALLLSSPEPQVPPPHSPSPSTLVVSTRRCTPHPSLTVSLPLQHQWYLPHSNEPFILLVMCLILSSRNILLLKSQISKSYSQSKNSYFHNLCEMKYGHCSNSHQDMESISCPLEYEFTLWLFGQTQGMWQWCCGAQNPCTSTFMLLECCPEAII